MHFAGVDEAGRGPLAGPVVAAAVILHPQKMIEGLQDSKKLTPKKREKLAPIIKNDAFAWGIGIASVEEIDTMNILQATFLAMKRAVEQLTITPDCVLVDGHLLPNWHYNSRAIIQGDKLESCISAASILAKVTRDQYMMELHADYPHYQFDQHKGYPTATHIQLLREHGVSPVHRRSFKPVAILVKEKHND